MILFPVWSTEDVDEVGESGVYLWFILVPSSFRSNNRSWDRELLRRCDGPLASLLKWDHRVTEKAEVQLHNAAAHTAHHFDAA